MPGNDEGPAFRRGPQSSEAGRPPARGLLAQALAVCETHFPKAFFLFLLVPYFSANAVASAVRSVLHSCAALSAASSTAGSRLAMQAYMAFAVLLAA